MLNNADNIGYRPWRITVNTKIITLKQLTLFGRFGYWVATAYSPDRYASFI